MSDISTGNARGARIANAAAALNQRVHNRQTTRATALVLAAVLACAIMPSSAEAQFGRLMKKVAKKAAGASGAAPSAEVPAPVFTTNVLEITDARLGQLLKGLDAERDARPALRQQNAAAVTAYEAAERDYEAKKAAYDRDQAAYVRKSDAYERCSEQVEAKYEKESATDQSPEEKERADDAREAEMETRAQRMQALAERMQAARARGDQKAAQVLADSLRQESSATMALSASGMDEARKSDERDRRREADRAKCGDPGKAPVPPKPPTRTDSPIAEALERVGAQASGLTTVQYAILRERVAAYVNVDGQFASGNKYAFSDDELDVLRRHSKELTARGEELAPYGAWRFAPQGS